MTQATRSIEVDLPGLNAIAQQKFDLPYEELSPSLQSHVREEAVRRAGNDLLAALKRAIAFIGETQEYKTGHTGANSIVRDGATAIRLAEGK